MNLSIIYINDSFKIINVPFTNVTKDGFFSHTFSEKAFVIGIIIDSNLKTNYQSFKNELSPLENYYYQKEYPPLSIDSKEFRDKGSVIQFQVDGLGLTQSYPKKQVVLSVVTSGLHKTVKHVATSNIVNELTVKVFDNLGNFSYYAPFYDSQSTFNENRAGYTYQLLLSGNPVYAPKLCSTLIVKQYFQF